MGAQMFFPQCIVYSLQVNTTFKMECPLCSNVSNSFYSRVFLEAFSLLLVRLMLFLMMLKHEKQQKSKQKMVK